MVTQGRESGRLFLVHAHPGLRVQGIDAGGALVRAGERLRIGRASTVDISVYGEDVMLGGHANAIVAMDEHGKCTVSDTGHANVARNGLLGEGKGGELRDGDIVDLYTTGDEVGLTLRYERVAADGAEITPAAPARLIRDFLSFWEPNRRGRAHRRERELVVQRDGAVFVLDHGVRAHPDDARVLCSSRLSPAAFEALARAVETANVRDFAPWEHAGAASAALVFLERPRGRTITLGKDITDGNADGPTFVADAAHHIVQALRSLFVATNFDVASDEPPPPTERTPALSPEVELLVYTEWSGGNGAGGATSGSRLIVFASGVAVLGHVKAGPSDDEIFEDQRRTSLDHATMVRVRWIARDPALDGGTHGAGTVYDTHRVVDVHRHGRRLRTTFSRIGSSS